MNQFRLIVDPPLPGARNMAIDQALLDSAGEPDGGMTLRLYQWQPATVSLGYFQTLASRDKHESSRDGEIVRRTTGGGAIIHDHELTYSLTLPLTDRWSARHRELYDTMHHVIIDSLADWGIKAELWEPLPDGSTLADKNEFLCFLRRAIGDIVLDGFKIGGSAQRRSQRSLLQHGSILIGQSVLAPELPGIQELSGVSLDIEKISDKIVSRFARTCELGPVRGEMTSEERLKAGKWEKNRFGNDCWTCNR
jgi:lipoate-protein ligase A